MVTSHALAASQPTLTPAIPSARQRSASCFRPSEYPDDWAVSVLADQSWEIPRLMAQQSGLWNWTQPGRLVASCDCPSSVVDLQMPGARLGRPTSTDRQVTTAVRSQPEE